MSAQHTPGPLRVIKSEIHEENQFIIESDLHSTEGNFFDRYVSFSGYFGNYGPHMFAAAPDLLEALDTLNLVIGLTPIAGNREALQEACDIARAAIAKAKGGQP